MLIKGFKNYLDNYDSDDVIMLFVGDGPARDDLELLTKSLNIYQKVKFIGKIDNTDVFKYYLISDFFLNASISETQGLTFMEAMASSVPVLCRFDNNLVGVINNNKTGFFFVDEKETIFRVNKKTEIKKQKGKTISFIPMTDTVSEITLTGFEYPLDKHTLRRGDSICTSNIIKEEKATIEFSRGKLLGVIQNK